MNLLQGLGQRVKAVIGAIIGGSLIFVCGFIMAFVVSPSQAIEWRRIQNLPELTPSEFAALSSGEDLAITGTLSGNQALTPDGLVLYERSRFEVDPPDDNDNTADGSWTPIESVYPTLKMDFSGTSVDVLAAESITLNLVPHEIIEDAPSGITATYGDQTLHEGAIRTSGFKNGDLVTVVGKKASVGGIVPNRIAGGDRVQLVEDIRAGARIAFVLGIAMMICAPIAIIGGVFGGLFFGKRKSMSFNIG